MDTLSLTKEARIYPLLLPLREDTARSCPSINQEAVLTKSASMLILGFIEVALAYSTDGRDGRGGGAPLLCVASGGRSTSARSLIADDPAHSVGR